MMHPIRFGDWVWTPDTLELRFGSRVVTLEPRVARLLEFLLDHPGELLTHDRLVEAVWDGRIVSNEAVRRAIFALRQALAAEGCASFIRTVHKKGYIAEFPPYVVEAREGRVSPAALGFEEGSRTSGPAATPAKPAAVETAHLGSSRRLRVILGLAIAIALAAVLLPRLDLSQEPRPAPPAAEVPPAGLATIAVLPFVNLSQAADGEVLAEGLAEELLGTLALNPELRVTARTSAFQFRAPDRDARDVGRRLGVRYILDGSVRNAGERVRIRTRLVDAQTGRQLWSDEYERSLVDWFDLQQVVAAEVTRALAGVQQQHSEPVARTGGTTSVEAHLEVLRARQLLATRAVADAEQAIEHLQRALLLDADYALAYARLADAILIQARSTKGIRGARPVVAPLLDKSLALDPGLGEAYCLRSLLTDDPAAAERELRRGLELNPSYARGYELLADLTGSVESIDSAIALDPLTPGNYHTKALLMMGQGDWDAAAELDRRALELNPNFGAALVQLAQVVSVEGHFAEAIGYNRRALDLDPRAVPPRGQLVTLYLAVGDLDAARAVSKPPTPFGNWAILWAEGNQARVIDMIYGGQPIPIEKIDPLIGSQILLRQAVTDGDYARALAVISPLLPTGYELPPEVQGWGLYPYANIAQLLKMSGEVAAASHLEDQIEDRMTTVEARFPRYAILNDQIRAVLLARAGRDDEACTALERAYLPRPRPLWRVVLANPAFDAMYTTSCLPALRARIEQYVAAERERMGAVERAEQTPASAPDDDTGAAT